jgi:hypothetical protein
VEEGGLGCCLERRWWGIIFPPTGTWWKFSCNMFSLSDYLFAMHFLQRFGISVFIFIPSIELCAFVVLCMSMTVFRQLYCIMCASFTSVHIWWLVSCYYYIFTFLFGEEALPPKTSDSYHMHCFLHSCSSASHTL